MLRDELPHSVTDPFLTTFYYVEKRNGILRKNRGRGLKNLTYAYMGVRGKQGQNHAYIINEWPLSWNSGLLRLVLEFESPYAGMVIFFGTLPFSTLFSPFTFISCNFSFIRFIIIPFMIREIRLDLNHMID